MDDALRQQEMEYKQREEEYITNIHNLELKLKEKEYQINNVNNNQMKLEEVQKALRQSEKVLKHIEWELEDTRNSYNAKVSDLERENKQVNFFEFFLNFHLPFSS